MGYSVTPKGADVLEILRVFENKVSDEVTLPEVDIEYEEIKSAKPVPEHLLPDILVGMAQLDLIQYEPTY